MLWCTWASTYDPRVPSRPGRPSRAGRLAPTLPCAAAVLLLLAPGPAAAQGSPSSDPLDVGPVPSSAPPTPAAAPEPVERPTDPVTRTLQLALGGAVLLGLAGVTGLYLTREHR